MAIDLSIMFIITILRSKYCGAYRAGKVVYVVLSIEGCDIGSAKGAVAFMANQIESSEIICLAEGILPFSVFFVNRKELRGDDLATVLRRN